MRLLIDWLKWLGLLNCGWSGRTMELGLLNTGAPGLLILLAKPEACLETESDSVWDKRWSEEESDDFGWSVRLKSFWVVY
ncbi:hypothetical protein Ddc_11889 [Ditylenchus destructor]|nr:hypothetical protein Ddc_11889 [Ditylenchus destructor]